MTRAQRHAPERPASGFLAIDIPRPAAAAKRRSGFGCWTCAGATECQYRSCRWRARPGRTAGGMKIAPGSTVARDTRGRSAPCGPSGRLQRAQTLPHHSAGRRRRRAEEATVDGVDVSQRCRQKAALRGAARARRHRPRGGCRALRDPPAARGTSPRARRTRACARAGRPLRCR